MTTDITNILSLIIQLVVTIFGTIAIWGVKRYFLPWIESKLSKNEMDTLKDFVATMIKAAEQLEKTGYFDTVEDVAKAKKEYVLKAVNEQMKKIGFSFDEKVISDVIEGLIKETKNPDTTVLLSEANKPQEILV